MYEKDGEKYFVVDSHMHYWNAGPDNWVPGAEQYAKGWIECFHAYQGLGPAETHWPIEKFQKYTEDDLMKDVFEDGYVDVAIFQPTYLTEWYKEGFNTTERNAALGAKHPGKFIANTRWDPREGDDGLKKLAENVERYGSKGVKLYTAEWREGSRGWTLKDPAAYRYLEACQELGIKNVHVHKGPTIWPLDKDAFDVSDVDHAATDFPELNFIVEHVGLPRIEDFCFMATQEPNVYAGLSVVIGGLMHARPKFFAKVMGELLFWVGEDKMTFGSDYGIWEPKWQIEGFVDWDYPSDEFSDYPRVTTATKKKILGLNAAKLYGIEVPAEFQLDAGEGTPAARDDAVGCRRSPRRPQLVESHRPSAHRGIAHRSARSRPEVRDPELDEPITVARLRRVGRGVRRRRRRQVHLRLPTYFCAPNFAYLMVADAYDAVSAAGRRAPDGGGARRPLRGRRDQRRGRRAGRVRRRSFEGEAVGELDALRADFLRKAVLAGTDQVCRPLVDAGATPADLAATTLGDVPPRRPWTGCAGGAPELGLPAGDDAPLLVDPRSGAPVGVRRGAAAPAPGPPDPDQPRRQHRHLPRHAAAPLFHGRARGGRS